VAKGTRSRRTVARLRQSYPAPIALMLSTKSDKSLLLQAEAVEIRILLDYYPARIRPRSHAVREADPQQRAYRPRGRRCGKRSQ
jgi:hypothetical protein